jgi:Tfp pilus assembly protein PilF
MQKQGDPSGAAASFGRVIREHPEDRANTAIAHFELAEIDMASGALPSAIDHYRSALAIDSSDVRYANNLAFALIEAGRPNEALPVLGRALARFPGQAWVHKNYGLALLRSDAAHEAIAAFDRALELDPSLASARGLRAEARAQAHDARGARTDWDAYLAMAHDETERAEIEARLRAMGTIVN